MRRSGRRISCVFVSLLSLVGTATAQESALDQPSRTEEQRNAREVRQLQQMQQELRQQRAMLEERNKELREQLAALKRPDEEQPAQDSVIRIFNVKRGMAEETARILKDALGNKIDRITPHNDANLLIISATEKNFDSITGLLRVLDQDVAQSSEQRVVRVFKLVQSRADRIAKILQQVLRDKVDHLAADSVANSLIISAYEKDYKDIAQLIDALDVPGGVEDAQDVTETLQVRTVWITDTSPETGELTSAGEMLPPQVIDAVQTLGTREPRIICQHVAMVAKRPNEVANFDFQVPAFIGPSLLTIQGKGTLRQSNHGLYELQLSSMAIITVGKESKPGWQISGSVAMPQRHYLVMGTTNLVLEADSKLSTHPATFVVYLDRANVIDERISPESREAPERGPAGRRGRGAGRGRRGSPFSQFPPAEETGIRPLNEDRGSSVPGTTPPGGGEERSPAPVRESGPPIEMSSALQT
jgi:hypothetical protein